MESDDVKKLQSLYEDLGGYNTPQYGSNSPLITPSGVGSLKSAYVEVPEIDETSDQKDDEDQTTETPIQKLIDGIRDTIQNYEDKKKRRESVDLKLEENFVINEFISFVNGFNDGLKQGPIAAVNAANDLVGAFKDSKKEKGSLLVGGSDNEPIKGKYIHSGKYEDAIAQIVKVINKNQFNIFLIKVQLDNKNKIITSNSDYVFVRIRDDKTRDESSWIIVRKQYAQDIKDGKIKGKSIIVDPNTNKDQVTITAEVNILNKLSQIKDWYYIDFENSNQKGNGKFTQQGQFNLPPPIPTPSTPAAPQTTSSNSQPKPRTPQANTGKTVRRNP
jgi:hypothetical protein